MSYTDERHEQEARDREVRAKIERIRTRVRRDDMREPTVVVSVIKAILDLLGDEL